MLKTKRKNTYLIKYAGALPAIFFAVFLFFSNSASAAPDATIYYQGKLTNTSDVAVPDASYNFKFRIYDAASGGNCLWSARGTCVTPTPKSVAVSMGIFSTAIGEAGDNTLDLDFNSNYWLEVTVAGDSPMNVRKKINAAGYAINSIKLNGQDAAYYDTSLGKSGGRTMVGGTGTTDDLTLKTTSGNGASGADMIFQTGNNGGTEAMRILYNGNVGIGTTAPASLLTLAKDNAIGIATSDGSDNGYLGLTGAGVDGISRGGTIYLSGNERSSDPGTVVLQAGNVSGGHIIMRTGNAAEIMRITNGGNVGIGTTTPSTFKLEVAGNIGPEADNTRDLGSSGRRWANIYATNIVGSIVPSGFTQGPVVFGASGGALAQDNALFWDNSNKRLGIGTTSPAEKLEVAGNLKLNAGTPYINLRESSTGYDYSLKIQTDGRLSFINDDQVTEKVSILQNGNVGIGTTGPGAELHVAADGNADGYTSILLKGTNTHSRLMLDVTQTTNYIPVLDLMANGVIGGRIFLDRGSSPLYTGTTQDDLVIASVQTSKSMHFVTDNATAEGIRMTITGGGNVGIGTTTPGALLQVGSLAETIPATYAGTLKVTGATQTTLEAVGGIELPVAGDGYSTKIQALSASGADLIFAGRQGVSTWSEYMRIQHTGNVGIGTTSPQGNLHIARTTSGQNLLLGNSYNVAAAYSRLGFAMSTNGADVTAYVDAIKNAQDSNATSLSFNVHTGAIWANPLYLKYDGNVGIGTTSPTSPLHVYKADGYNSTSPVATIANMDGSATEGNGLFIRAGADSASSYILQAMDNGGNVRLYVRGDGNVGIGTTNPLQPLHVQGHCMTGDTLLPIRRRRRRKKSSADDEDFNPILSKNDLDENDLEFDYLFVPIRDILPGDEVMSLNEATNEVEYHKVNALMDMGVKEIYEIKTKSGRVIRTTSTHPYLVQSSKFKVQSGLKLKNKLSQFVEKLGAFFITIGRGEGEISSSRDISASIIRDITYLNKQTKEETRLPVRARTQTGDMDLTESNKKSRVLGTKNKKFLNKNHSSIQKENLSKSVINLPLKSESALNLRNKLSSEQAKLGNVGGETLNKTIPKKFSGGNKLELAKSLSWVKIILDSFWASNPNSSSEEPLAANLTSCPPAISNLANLNLTFSSTRNFIKFVRGYLNTPPLGGFSGITQSGADMLLSKRRKIIGNKLISRFSGGQHFQNLPNHNSGSLESKFAVADGRVSDDVLVDSDSHKNNINDYCDDNCTSKKTDSSNYNDNTRENRINSAEPTISEQGIQKKIAEITQTEENSENQPLEGSVLEVNCPYCQSANFVKRGLRKKKLETIQLYLCNDCRRTFTPKAVKGKRYPLSIILNAISLYNLGYSLEKVCQGLGKIRDNRDKGTQLQGDQQLNGTQDRPAYRSGRQRDDKKSAQSTDSSNDNNLLLSRVVENNQNKKNSDDNSKNNSESGSVHNNLLASAIHKNNIGEDKNYSDNNIGEKKTVGCVHNFVDGTILMPINKQINANAVPLTKDAVPTCPDELGIKKPINEEAISNLDTSVKNSDKRSSCSLDNFNLSMKPSSDINTGNYSKNFQNRSNGLPNAEISPTTVSNWIAQFSPLCRFLRFRDYAMQKFRTKDFIETATLAHRQLYRFRYHRAKMAMMILDDFRHFRFKPLQEFLENVSSECPHQYFQEGLRASEAPLFFSKKEMIVRGKENYATRLAKFVLESVGKNRDRHEALQKFMLINDSVTVATEVPVYLRAEDIAHMQTQLGFKLYSKPNRKKSKKNSKGEDELLKEITAENIPKLITGHIDMLQVRNGLVHILDYKPQAEKERPVEQLVLYALALSRLTGLRLFNFKCAWFDEKDYFEFFPLHAVYKPNRKRKKIKTIEGEYLMNRRGDKFDSIRPVEAKG